MKIPKKFYNVNGDGYPVVIETVGDLKQALKELPNDLKLVEDKIVLTVFNVTKDIPGEAFLSFESLDTI